MRAIDTNVLVRLITRDEPKQAEAADAFVVKGAWVGQQRSYGWSGPCHHPRIGNFTR
jgi:hypothetical protein